MANPDHDIDDEAFEMGGTELEDLESELAHDEWDLDSRHNCEIANGYCPHCGAWDGTT